MSMNPESRRVIRAAVGAILFALGLATLFGATPMAASTAIVVGVVFTVLGFVAILGAL